MIPRHRPPFGLWAVLAAIAGSGGRSSTKQLEQAYANELGATHAVWLPSARYGISRAIELVLEPDATVYCPAFTCRVVHDAVMRSGRTLQLVDCNRDDMLMDRNILSQSATHNHAVILSEVFGHRYESDSRQALVQSARLRIFDEAMAIPTPQDLQRLSGQDVALISFGLGKSLYSGWGGMALTHDDDMADWLRECCQRDIQPASLKVRLRQNAEVVFRTAAHTSTLYKLARNVAEKRSSKTKQQTSPANNKDNCSAQPTTTGTGNSQESLPREWWQPATSLHLNLAMQNLRKSADFAQQRQTLASEYRTQLLPHSDSRNATGSLNLRLPPATNEALSHFCIRVDASVRDALREFLWANGIDTAALFATQSSSPEPQNTSSADSQNETAGSQTESTAPEAEAHILTSQPAGTEFNAQRLMHEIIGLPLSTNLNISDVRRICELISRFAGQQTVADTSLTSHRQAA